jgi:hypothetical protein
MPRPRPRSAARPNFLQSTPPRLAPCGFRRRKFTKFLTCCGFAARKFTKFAPCAGFAPLAAQHACACGILSFQPGQRAAGCSSGGASPAGEILHCKVGGDSAPRPFPVIPAKAGIQDYFAYRPGLWIPAFAGMAEDGRDAGGCGTGFRKPRRGGPSSSVPGWRPASAHPRATRRAGRRGDTGRCWC